MADKTARASRRRAPRKVEATSFYLIRHGLTPSTGSKLPGRAPGLHLSDDGAAQARGLVALLDGVDFDAIYSSPMERALETAAPLAKARRMRVRTEARLVEMDSGDWTGKSLKALARTSAWEAVQIRPAGFRMPGGESVSELQSRFLGALERLGDVHPGGRVAVFSHADPIKIGIASLVGMPIDLFQRLVIEPASVSVMRVGRLGVALCCLNVTAGDGSGRLRY